MPPTAAVVPPNQMTPDPFDPVHPLINRLFRYFKPGTRGANVYLMADGTYMQDATAPLPNGAVGVTSGIPAYWNAQGDASVFVRTVNWDGTTTTEALPAGQPAVVKVYWGGCANPITAAEQTALTAAGYGPFIT